MFYRERAKHFCQTSYCWFISENKSCQIFILSKAIIYKHLIAL